MTIHSVQSEKSPFCASKLWQQSYKYMTSTDTLPNIDISSTDSHLMLRHFLNTLNPSVARIFLNIILKKFLIWSYVDMKLSLTIREITLTSKFTSLLCVHIHDLHVGSLCIGKTWGKIKPSFVCSLLIQLEMLGSLSNQIISTAKSNTMLI